MKSLFALPAATAALVASVTAGPPVAMPPMQPQFVAATDGKPEPTYVGPKRFNIPAYSVTFPGTHTSKLTNWVMEGSTTVTSRGIQISDEKTGLQGSMWNIAPITTDTFDVEFDVEVSGPNEAKTADGFALWLVSEEDYSTFLHQPSGEVWTLFGYKPNFAGFVAMFATSDRGNNPTASISALVNNGTRAIDIIRDVPSGEGVYFNYRNGQKPLKVRIQFTPEQVKCTMRWANEYEWRNGFTSKLPAGGLPARGYLGFTASNRRTPKGEANAAQLSGLGDKTLISKIEVLTTDFDAVHRPINTAQEMFGHVIDMDSSDASLHVKMLADAISRAVISNQEHILSEINRLQIQNRHLSERLDIVQTFLTTGANDRDLRDALERLKSMVFENSRGTMNKIEQLRGGLNVDELSRRSAELEETLTSHANRNQWLTLGLGILLVGFGAGFYKRMRDMEKKHLL